jgi:hypothetical protein
MTGSTQYALILINNAFTVENIIEALKSIMMDRIGDKLGYHPVYTRNDITDKLNENLGARTDYEIITDLSMRRIIRETKKKK